MGWFLRRVVGNWEKLFSEQLAENNSRYTCFKEFSIIFDLDLHCNFYSDPFSIFIFIFISTLFTFQFLFRFYLRFNFYFDFIYIPIFI